MNLWTLDSRPAVSQHLNVLADCGLVTVLVQGTRHISALDPPRVRVVRDYFPH